MIKAEWTNRDNFSIETTGQSKSILVIDTPTHCGECPVKCRIRGINHIPTWCPLRPLPEKIEDIMHTEFQTMDVITDKFIADIRFETDKLIALGYNACLDEIVGDNDDEV